MFGDALFSREYKTMKRILFYLLTITLLTGCGGISGEDFLNEISGVWGVQGERGLFTIIYKDKKFSMLVNDVVIPVTVGDIDNVNKTVNLITLQDGKPAILTLRQIWVKDNKSFYLQLTLHDGIQANLNFVRKISTDDLNKVAHAEVLNQPSGGGTETASAAKEVSKNASSSNDENHVSHLDNVDSVLIRSGKLAVTGELNDMRLLFNGENIRDGDGFSLSFVEKYAVGDTDIVLMMNNSGGTACPVQYFFVSISIQGIAKLSPEFGTCSDLAKSTQSGSNITVTMPKMDGQGDAEYIFTNGDVTENGELLK